MSHPATVTVPLVQAKTLWHLGTLNPAQRGERGPSLEGNLFSVSTCPNAWQQIAKLGAQPLHKSTQPVLLINMIDALDEPEYAPLRDAVMEYGAQQGWLEATSTFRVTYHDDELESDVYLDFLDAEEAEAEAAEREADVLIVPRVIATDALKEIHNLPRHDIHDGLEFALIEWAREQASSLTTDQPIAGVYWAETYAPMVFSAPRGGVFDPQSLGLQPSTERTNDFHTLQGVQAIDDAQWSPDEYAPDNTLTL
ncbi:hypothetical protein [Geopseudomonas aromaticivorans]